MRRIRWMSAVALAVVGVFLLCAMPSLSAMARHTVRKGESLAEIAQRYNVPLSRLIELNRSRFPRGNPDLLYTGTTILVPVKQPVAPAAPPAINETPAAPAPPPEKSPAQTTAADERPGAGPPLTEDNLFPPEKNVSSLSPEARKAARQQIYGTVTDARSRPIEGASIVTDHGDYTSTSKADGSYSIAGVEPGTYAVTVSRAGFGSHTATGIVVKEGERSPASFQLRSPSSSTWSAPWMVVAGLIILILVVALALMMRMISSSLNAAEPRDSGLLRLIATRELGKGARVHWLRAGERDLFVTEGVDVHMLPADTLREPEALPSPGSSSSAQNRRPRKNGPTSPDPD